MKRHALLSALVLAAFAGPGVAQEARFGDAVAAPAYVEKVSVMLEGQPDWVKDLVTMGGVSAPGRQILLNGQIYGEFDTCRPKMCDMFAVKLIVRDGEEAYLKVYGASVEGGPYVLGEPDAELEAAILEL